MSSKRLRKFKTHGIKVPSNLEPVSVTGHNYAGKLSYIPFVVPLVSLSASVYLVRPELKEPLIQLPRSPIEPDPLVISSSSGKLPIVTHFGYELSPKPNDAKFTPWRNVGDSRLTSNDFQNNRPFAGISPCPVVDATRIVNVCFLSDSYLSHSVSFTSNTLLLPEIQHPPA